MCALAALAVFATAAPALAKDLPKGGLTADETAAWLSSRGLTAEVLPDPTRYGNQIVRSSADGVNFQIYYYGCVGRSPKVRCESIQYSAEWARSEWASTDRVNAWDRERRFLRAYLGPNGTVWAEFDFDVSPEVSYAALDRSLQRWRAEALEFRRYMGLR
jgi:hypothetical protein